MKNTMNKISFKLALAASGLFFAGSIFAGCAQDMASAPVQQSTQSQLLGTWDYISTDGYDLADYGITYFFTEKNMVYSIPEKGQKDYSYQLEGTKFHAVLDQNSLGGQEQLGNAFDGTFTVEGSKLVMDWNGHTGLLERHVD